jgi:hypothetical protein
MTKEYLTKTGTFADSTILGKEITQFKRLLAEHPNLTDEEYAHRLVTSPKQVQKLRNLIGG